MITTEAYFSNIRENLEKELNLAQESIFVAVAWFTDKSLFQTLIDRQKGGIKVSLIITKDDINRDSGIIFSQLESSGGYFKAIDGNLMHNKFCVIDKRIVITGSYNWTYKASALNEENITITQGDFDLAFKFIQRFNIISGREGESDSPVDYLKIVKRISILRDQIGLGDEEDIRYQVNRLKKESLDPETDHILTLISEHQYDNALRAINTYVNSKSTVVHYTNPRIAALQLEIKALEFRIISFDEALSEKRRTMRRLSTLYYTALGDILSLILAERTRYYNKIKNKSEYHKGDYEKAQNEEKAFEEEKQQIEEKPSKTLDPVQEKNLKKLYREAVMICHPDKVDKQLKEKATVLFKELQQAYEQQDISKVAEIIVRIKAGTWDDQSNYKINDVDILIAKRNDLEQKLERIFRELEAIRNDQLFNELSQIENIDEYLAQKRIELEEEYTFWKEKNVEVKEVSAA